MDDVVQRRNLGPNGPIGAAESPRLPIAGVLGPRTRSSERPAKAERKDSGDGSAGTGASSFGEDADAYTELRSLGAGRSVHVKQTSAENFRNWEIKMRKQALLQNSPQPEDLQRDYRFWELKMRKGELDSLLQKSKQTWLLDKVAEIPETLQLGSTRTFWELKATDPSSDQKRCFSMPPRERPPSVGPSFRPPLRAAGENDVRPEEAVLQDVFSTYFDQVDEDTLRKNTNGRTLMVQGLKNKFSFDDILGVFDELGAKHVDYVFLPLSVWETKKSEKKKSSQRNKGYCFVHFSDVAASEAFVEVLSQNPSPKEARGDSADPKKEMHASLSSTQGIVQNLLRLMDIHSRKWHPRAGALVLRLGDRLVPVNVASLRTFLLDVLKRDPMTAPGCLQKHCTFSRFFDPTPAGVSRPPLAPPLSSAAA